MSVIQKSISSLRSLIYSKEKNNPIDNTAKYFCREQHQLIALFYDRNATTVIMIALPIIPNFAPPPPAPANPPTAQDLEAHLHYVNAMLYHNCMFIDFNRLSNPTRVGRSESNSS